MFSFAEKRPRSPKCYYSHTRLTRPKDGEHKPNPSKQPFRSFQSLPFAHTVVLILPEEVYDVARQQLEGSTFRYSRVFLSLLDIISGDFFNQYIKTGNVVMRSEGRALIDNLFTLQDGILRLELDRPTYERCGLAGKPIPDGGRKHAKARYLVELNLRLPSMLHGKKGFERIVWAFKNVLNHSLTWLFVDTNAPEEAVSADDAPIKKHHPFGHLVKPEVTRMTDVSVPVMPSPGGEIELEYAEELFEWLGLVALDSLRIRASDEVDPFLCRYQIPQPTSEDGMPVDDSSQPSSIVKLRWHGFASAKAVLDVFLTADNAVMKHWMAMSVSGFDGKASTVLGMGGKEYLCWECD